MFGIENYTGFILACIILNLTPGVDTFYILTRSVSQGRKAGLVSAAGIITGCLVHVLAAAFGLSLILTTSNFVFSLVKWAGALYLICLGIKTFMDKENNLEMVRLHDTPLKIIYKQGVITNVLNPKVALFFLSFLPQFVHAKTVASPLPFLFLGATFLCTSSIWLSTLSMGASSLTRTLRENQRVGVLMQRASGIIFIGFGLKLALDPTPN